MTGRAFTRSELNAMRQEDLAERIDEVNAWAAAGAIDGQAPPEAKREFTRAELLAMSPDQAAANIDAINAQVAAGGIG